MKSFPAMFFAVGMLIIGTGVHVTLAAWAVRAWPKLAKHWRALLGLSVLFSLLPSVTRQFMLHTRDPVADAFHAASMVEIAFVIAVAPGLFVLQAFARWRERRAASAKAVVKARPEAPVAPTLTPTPSPPSVPEVGRRDALTTIGGAAVLGGTGLALGWGATRGRHDFQVCELAVKIPGLPRALDGYTLVQVSDLHAGLFVTADDIRDGLRRARALRPDLLVVTGDLLDFDTREAPALGRALMDVAPRDGVVGIVGNHDYYAGVYSVIEAMKSAGITMLVNESRMMRVADGGGFALIGADDEWAPKYGGKGRDLDRAMAGLPPDAPRILLAHQPRTIEGAAGRVALQLSGHTHGGQIRPWDLVLPWAAGRYEESGTTLYVNRGFGVAGPPARIGVPPEVTKVVLVAG
jgi:predicted MPP superfamily phosphohydrolase